MTCDEFRDERAEREPTEPGWGDDPRSLALVAHRAGCPACARWEGEARALDAALGAALVVSVPFDLAARLAELPGRTAVAPVRRSAGRPRLGTVVVEAAIFLALGLGLLGLGAALFGWLLAPALAQVGGLLQALPLLLATPLVAYFQSLVITMVEALATLILLALGLLQIQPALFADRSPNRHAPG
jgi:hypothetical protein